MALSKVDRMVQPYLASEVLRFAAFCAAKISEGGCHFTRMELLIRNEGWGSVPALKLSTNYGVENPPTLDEAQRLVLLWLDLCGVRAKFDSAYEAEVRNIFGTVIFTVPLRGDYAPEEGGEE